MHLLAAGPGDPGLWTVRAERLLASAPVVVCDRELADAVRSVAPAAAIEIVDGPEDAAAILVAHARTADGIVRLARGDRLVWEHGGHEAGALATAGLPYVVEPAVVAAFAEPAARGVPVMSRALAATLAVAVGVEAPAIAGGTVVTEAADGTSPGVAGAVTALDLGVGVRA